MLRKQYGLTLEDVATAVGVGKSTVRKWEKGMILNMGRDKIQSLALVLHTSPAYLMGWEQTEFETHLENEIKLIEQIQNHFDKETVDLIRMFHELNAEGKCKALNMIEDLTLLDKYKR